MAVNGIAQIKRNATVVGKYENWTRPDSKLLFIQHIRYILNNIGDRYLQHELYLTNSERTKYFMTCILQNSQKKR